MLTPVSASAHPLGNFTVNRYSRLEVGAAAINIYYVLDMAEIPTYQEKDSIDLNHDGQISQTEQAAYLDRKVPEIQANLKLSLNKNPLTLKALEKNLSFPPGQGSLPTTRLTIHFQSAALSTDANEFTYEDTNYSDRLGWREIVICNADGVALQKSSVSSTDQSDELRTYPQDMLASPLNISTANAAFKLDPNVKFASTQNSSSKLAVRTNDPFADLINGGELTPIIVLSSLGLAFVLGIFHAFSPGHGKTIVAAYLVGSRGTARHAGFLGLVVTVTHTIGVFALGLITLFASQFILPEKLFPWLGLISGLLVLWMGFTMFRSRLRLATAIGASPAHDHDHDHNEHDHNHDHNHDHDHEQLHQLGLEHTHDHAAEKVLETVMASSAATAEVGREPLTANGLSQSSDHEHHDHDHDHADHDHDHSLAHSHTDHDHDHADHDHNHDHDHQEDSDHDHDSGLTHSHGGKMHSHLPPGADGTTLTWKRLLLFGISAGILPCPSALVVMLSAIALNRTAFGLIMVVFFSLGLAGALTAIGIILVYARQWLNRFNIKAGGRVLRWLPIMSAGLIAILGLFITIDGLVQIGLLKF